MKNLIKKASSNIKADASAIFNAIDLASGGFVSSTKESIANVYRGYLENKFNNLILDITANTVSQDELLSFINSSSEKDREFLCNIVLKNIHADNRLTTFILAKLWANKIINDKLDYYESSLFANINTFTLEDFEIFFTVISSCNRRGDMVYFYDTTADREFYLFAIDKFVSFGFLQTANAVGGRFQRENERLTILFNKTPYSDTLNSYLQEYFEANK